VSEIVEENMANAARVHAIECGKDLAGVTMIAFGGAAPLHAGRLAQKLGIRRVIVVPAARASARRSASCARRSPSRWCAARCCRWPVPTRSPSRPTWQAMAAEALAVVAGRQAGDQPLPTTRLAELRYAGQGHELRMRLPEAAIDAAALADLVDCASEAFEQQLRSRSTANGSPAATVEVVTWSVTVSTVSQPPPRSRLAPPGPLTGAGGMARAAWEPATGRQPRFRPALALRPDNRVTRCAARR
jgi:N-methylhydantoinase A